MKKGILVLLALALVLGLCGCGGDGAAVTVQRADQLAIAGLAGERYAGVVVSENVVEITRDSTKRVEELYVKVGDEVKAGDKLFSYDSDELELALEKTQLEVEKMTNELADYKEQQEKLEKKLAKTWNDSDKVRLTLEINTLKATIMENEYNLKAKEKEIATLEEMLENIDITTPVDGTVRKIDEEGQSGSYITVQQSGAYRVQGMLNEMSMGGGIMPGSRVKVYSRVSEETWMGTVTGINTADASQNNGDMWNNYGMTDTMTLASSYVFDVELDSVEGLLLGQHVYIEVFVEQMPMEGLWIPESFLTDMVMNEETFEMTAKVFAENSRGKLEQRSVTLGMFDGMTGCYEVLSGITAEDYLADPNNPGCVAGAETMRREVEDFTGSQTSQETVPAQEEMTAPGTVPTEEGEGQYDIALPIETQPEGTEAVG